MSHLNTEELLDLAEGARAEATLPHLASCGACRGQLADLRAAMAAAEVAGPGQDDVPEPSPLFWEHFSARVREAIADEGTPQPPATTSWADRWLSWKIATPVAACLAVLLLAVAVTFRTEPRLTTTVEETAFATTADGIPDSGASSTDDPSWSLMTDLAGDLDWDAAVEAGLTAPAGGVDRALFDLSAEERRELQRLLKEELARSGV